MKISQITLAMLTLGWSLGSFAQDDNKSAFSLKEAQDYGVENHLSAKNARLNVEESRRKVQETIAIGLPQVSGEATFNHFIDIPVQVAAANVFDPNAEEDVLIPLQFGTNNNATATINATQLLFDGTYFVGLQASKTYMQLSEQSAEKSEIQIKDNVASSYYNVLIAEENQKIFSENVERLEEQLRQLTEMHKNGFIEETEVDQLALILSDAKKRNSTIKRQVEVTYQLLNFQMGREITEPLQLTDDLRSIYANYDEASLLQRDLKLDDHIDFRLMSTQEEIQLLQLKAERAVRYPSLGAFYQLSQNSFSNDYNLPDWYRSSVVGIKVSMPLFTSMGTTRKIQQRKIQLEKIQNDKEMLEDNLKIEVSVARTQYIDALEQFRTEQENLELSKKILDKTTQKQANGMASSIDVTVANNQYLETQGKYINALYNILKSKSTLDKALNNYN